MFIACKHRTKPTETHFEEYGVAFDSAAHVSKKRLHAVVYQAKSKLEVRGPKHSLTLREAGL